MTKHQTQKGFTLVELAIVMTIIGLLIGGILKGQELMNNARVTSTVAQVKGIEAAVTTFRDAYNAIPGDLGATASTRIPGCNLGCNNSATTAGDGSVGMVAWDWSTQFAATTGTATHTTTAQETGLFWTHLLMANLLGGVTDEGIRSALAATVAAQPWGSVRPAGRIGGGFIVGNADGRVPSLSTQTAGTGPVGMVLSLVSAPNSPATAAGSGNSLTPARAAQIDRKMDDGRPAVGNVQQFGAAPGTAACMSTTFAYNETLSTPSCGLIIRIQG